VTKKTFFYHFFSWFEVKKVMKKRVLGPILAGLKWKIGPKSVFLGHFLAGFM